MIPALPLNDEISDPSQQVAAKRIRENVMSAAMRIADANTLNDFAWKLVRMGGTNRSTTAMAVKAAERAAQFEPDQVAIENTLGSAYYRDGQWRHAIEALEKSMELRNGGDAFQWFFVAMTLWRLGDQAQARAWYDIAIEWTNKYQADNGELNQFRTKPPT